MNRTEPLLLKQEGAESPRSEGLDAARWAAELVTRYGDRARRVAHGILGNLDDAEDAVQEAFVRVVDHIDQWRGEAPLIVWIARIVVRCSHDILRRRRPVSPFDPEAAPPGRPWEDPERVAQARDELARVRVLLQELPPRPRTALVLKVVEEMTHREIAEVLGTTEQAARVYVAQARRFLRHRLAGAEPEEEPR